jgi:D-beta-D-heptose 7-phosphate kinase/D-beta-D-heptose 1-phosphate adenosyltransferase
MENKILSLEDFLIEKDRKLNNKKIVFTNGCFDILHPGHTDYLSKAKQLGDLLVLGLNSDESVKRLKGNSRPIQTENARSLVLSALTSVDYIILFQEDTPLNLIVNIKPDILVKGGDYTEENIVGADEVKANNGKVKIIPFLEGFSTSNIIEKIQSN